MISSFFGSITRKCISSLTAVAMLASFMPVGIQLAEAAPETLHTTPSVVVSNAAEFATPVVDATGYESLQLEFNFDATALDGPAGGSDSFTYGWRSGATDTPLATFAGLPSDDAAEIGVVSVALPVGAQVADLQVYVTVQADSAAPGDQVVITNLTISGEPLPPPPPPACAPQYDVAGPTAIQNTTSGEYFDTLQDAINDCDTVDGHTVVLSSNITTTAQVTINKAITLNGGGNTLDADFTKTDNNNNSAIGIQSDNVTVTNIHVTSSGDAPWPLQLHGINVYVSTGVILTDIEATNFEGSGVVVNGSEVTITDITTSGNGWHAINAAPGSGVTAPTILTVGGVSTHGEALPLPHIFTDDVDFNVTVNDTNNQYEFSVVPFPSTSKPEREARAWRLVEVVEPPVVVPNNFNLNVGGTVFHNRNGDRDRDDGEEVLEGWTMRLYKEGATEWEFVAETTSAANGQFAFPRQAEAGTYHVCEVAQLGWTQVRQDWSGTVYHIVTDNLSPHLAEENPYCATVVYTDEASRSTKKSFGNRYNDQLGQHQYNISGIVFNNRNGDRDRDDGEEVLEGWTMRLYTEENGVWVPRATSTTDSIGVYKFPTEYNAGVFHICQVAQSDWTQVLQNWSGTPYHIVTDNLSPHVAEENPYCATVVYTDEADRSVKRYFGVEAIPEPTPDVLLITNPATAYEVLAGEQVLTAEYIDNDQTRDLIQWAVRAGTCSGGSATVAGNVDGYTNASTYGTTTFAAAVDMSTWAPGNYCFVVNPREQAGEPDVRATRWFTIAEPIMPMITFPAPEQEFATTPILNQWMMPEEAEFTAVSYQIAYNYDDGHAFGGTNTCVGQTFDGYTGFIGCRDVVGTSRNHTPALTEQGGVTIWVRALNDEGEYSDWSEPVHYYYTVPTETEEGEGEGPELPPASPMVMLEACKYVGESPEAGWGMLFTNGTELIAATTTEDGCVSASVDIFDGPWEVMEETRAGYEQTSVTVSEMTGTVASSSAATETYPDMCVFARPVLTDEMPEGEVPLVNVSAFTPEFNCSFLNAAVETPIEVSPTPTTPGDGESTGGTPDVSFGNPSGGTFVGFASAPAEGLVLGASTSQCGMYLMEYLKMGQANDPWEVMKLQLFLTANGFFTMTTGVFDEATHASVKAYQAANASTILAPWVQAGFTTTMNPTGFVFKTTRHAINNAVCPGSEPMPTLN